MYKDIEIRGAREHNLKNLNLKIPKNKYTVITGVSGSGKSSLAFDTIYAEGQRRYVESLSAYARQFLDMMQKPDVDSIEGLSPSISIEQKTTSKNPRSTVGTVTEIYDYMRLLFARIGIPYSPTTGLPIKSQSVTEIVDKIKNLPNGTLIYIISPIVRGRKGEYKKELQKLVKQGFQRFKIDGSTYESEELPTLDKKIKHQIEVIVDRIKISTELGNRLADSVETALKLSDGIIFVEYKNKKDKKLIFSSKFACPISGFTIEEIEPRLFSFNNPYGACAQCDGLGYDSFVDQNMIVPDKKLSLEDGAIAPWSKSSSGYYTQTIKSLADHYKFSTQVQWIKLPQKIKDVILFGSDHEKIKFSYDDGLYKNSTIRPFEGVINNLERRYLDTDSDYIRNEISKYRGESKCKSCGGQRLKNEALSIRINKLNIADVTKKSITSAAKWFSNLENILTIKEREIANRILKEINERLAFLENVGLEYLTLSRNSGTLSGGESQRIRLASQIGSGLTGVLYVLDEPSIGLHQRDNKRLLQTLKKLRDLGNTVIVVEHDEEAIRFADHIIDMGPGAGIHGGKISFEGKLDSMLKSPKSLTGEYLSGKKKIQIPTKRKRPKNDQYLKILGAKKNNLKNVSVDIPLGVFNCITGVSGSGKSTLIINTLYESLSKLLNKEKIVFSKFDEIKGLEHLDKVIDIDQSPIGRTPRSNPATYTGAFTPIREWYANLPESKTRGYKVGRFSFNVKGGRCENCEGDGIITIEMHFLPDIYVKCDVCKGERYNRETLEIKYKNKSIADVLNMTVDENADFFKNIPSIYSKMKTLQQVGLNYIKVGQQATTLSGGEAQRIKLSKELSKRATGKTLYILDEPTTGLHSHDVKKLLTVLHTLVDQGNTVIVIEHNLDVIKTADWIIDLGPEGGDNGGNVVALGPPEKISRHKTSYTGLFLKKIFNMK